MEIIFTLIEMIIVFLVVTALPFGLIVWFILSLKSVVKRYRKNEKPSEEQIASLILSAFFLAGLIALIIYLVHVFSSGISFM